MQDKKNKIIPLTIAESRGFTAQMTHLMNMGEVHTRNIYIWYIDGPKKNIVVDTGGKAETLEKFDISSRQVQEPEEALKKIGLSTKDIDTVILTHAHFDHIQYADKFPNAEFIIQEDELRAARNPHPLFLFNYKIIQSMLDHTNFRTIQGDAKIAEGVRVLKTPGHSEGSQSVVVQTEKGKAIITGFCCVEANFNPPERIREVMPVIPPAIHIDLKAAYESIKKVNELADIIIPIHDHKYANIKEIP